MEEQDQTWSVASSEDAFDFLFKIILIGDSNVGKTCVVQSFKTGLFSERQQNTIGVDFTVRTLNINGKRVKMQVWDTAGQERFRTITQSYYRSAHGAIIIYDITRRVTFDSVPRWIHDVQRFGTTNVLMALIGNKCDVELEREVEFDDACQLADDRGMMAALETSAKHAHSIEHTFVMIARELLLRNGMKDSCPHEPDTRVTLTTNSRSISDPAPRAPDRTSCDC